jgi:hypothetical protein
MSDPQNLRETSWRRPLTASEEAELRTFLKDDPNAQADLELDLALSKGLERLPDVPVPSNFTARVLDAVAREAKSAEHRHHRLRWSWRRLVPKFAIAGLAACAVLFIQHQQAEAKRVQLVQSVAAVSSVSSLPSPEVLEDFEAIQRLNTTPPPDETLLALFR